MRGDDLGLSTFAAEARLALAARHGGDPVGELSAWVHVAQRREAIVSEAYSEERVEEQLGAMIDRYRVPGAAVRALREALDVMWRQERSHERYFEGVIRFIEGPVSWLREGITRIAFAHGHVEGKTLSGMVAPHPLRRVAARAVLAIGERVQEGPRLVEVLSRITDFAGFCRLSHALEVTAVAGYRRMADLMAQIAGPTPELAASPIWRVNQRVLADERYHARLFRLMAGWTTPREGRLPLLSLGIDRINRSLEAVQGRMYGHNEVGAHALGVEVDRVSGRDPIVSALRHRSDSRR